MNNEFRQINSEPNLDDLELDNTKTEIPLIDQLITNKGYHNTQYKILILIGLICFADGIHMTLLNSLYIPFQKYYDFNDFQMSIINSTLFIAVGLGSILSGSKYFTRIKAIKNSMLTIFICNLIFVLIPHYLVFCLVRLFIGFSIGLMMPMSSNLLCEYLPIKNRSFFMISIGFCISLGIIYMNIVMLIVMPNLEKEKLLTTFFYLSLPIGLSYLAVQSFIEDSPRNLIVNNEEEEGIRILENLLETRLSDEQKSIIINQVKNSSSNSKIEGKLRDMFNVDYSKITIILTILMIANSYIVYGGTFALSLTLKHLQSTTANVDAGSSSATTVNTFNGTKLIFDQLIIYSFGIPGHFLAGFMTEIKHFGRIKTTLIGFIFIGFFCFLGFFNLENFSLFFGLAGFFTSLSFCGITSYSSEIYPTKLRDLAIGYLFMVTRLCGFLSQFIAIFLTNIHFLGQYIATVIVCIISSWACLMLPYDTIGRPLDK